MRGSREWKRGRGAARSRHRSCECEQGEMRGPARDGCPGWALCRGTRARSWHCGVRPALPRAPLAHGDVQGGWGVLSLHPLHPLPCCLGPPCTPLSARIRGVPAPCSQAWGPPAVTSELKHPQRDPSKCPSSWQVPKMLGCCSTQLPSVGQAGHGMGPQEKPPGARCEHATSAPGSSTRSLPSRALQPLDD